MIHWRVASRTSSVLFLCFSLLLAASARCEEVPVRLQGAMAVPTFNCLGVSVNCDGTLPPDAACEIRYRKQGALDWRQGLNLIHCPRDRQFRGSLLNLEPNTAYEAECRLVRPGDQKGAPLPQVSVLAQTWLDEVPVGHVRILPESSDVPLTIGDQGKADAWIVYRPAEGRTSAIDVGTEAKHAVIIEKAAYVVIEDVSVRGGSADCVVVRDSHHVRIRRCDIAGWGEAGAPKEGLPKGLYVDKTGKVINYQAGVRVAENASQVVVESNFIHDPRGTANSWKYKHPHGPQGVLLWSTGGNNVVRDNDIIGSELHWWNDAIESYPNNAVNGGPYRDSDICGNVLAFANDDAAELDGGQINVRYFNNWTDRTMTGVSAAPVIRGPTYIFRNLFDLRSGGEDGNAVVGFKLGALSDSSGLAILAHNTVLSRSLGFSGRYYGTPPTAPPVLMRNNVFVCLGTAIVSNGYGPNEEAHGDFDYDLMKKDGIAPSGAGWEKHGVTGAPKFRSETEGDFRLQSDSPGVDAGVVLPSLNEDFTGKAADLGAFEHGQDEDRRFPRRQDGLSALPLRVNVDNPAPGKTSAAEISLTVPASAGARWTAHANSPYLRCEPASGLSAAGPQTVRVSVVGVLERQPAKLPYRRAAVTFRTNAGYNRTIMVDVQIAAK